jgi:hypothetical protein
MKKRKSHVILSTYVNENVVLSRLAKVGIVHKMRVLSGGEHGRISKK